MVSSNVQHKARHLARLEQLRLPSSFLEEVELFEKTPLLDTVPEDYKTEFLRNALSIQFFDLEGNPYKYTFQGNKFDYQHYRLQVPNRGHHYYYNQKAGRHVFLTPGIIAAHQAKETIDTVYLVEGSFRAFGLWAHAKALGIDLAVVGLPDIGHFKDKENQQLDSDLTAIYRDCEPKAVVVLLGSNVDKLPALSEDLDVDLSRQLRHYFYSIRDLRERSLKVREMDFYLAELHPELASTKDPKFNNFILGIDDLLSLKSLSSEEDKPEQRLLIQALQKQRTRRNELIVKRIDAAGLQDTKGRFFLTLPKGLPQPFYNRFESQIKDNPFIFNGSKYQNIDGELTQVAHRDSKAYIRVGTKYFKILFTPNSKKVLERKLEPWDKATINDDYVNRGVKNFFHTIDKFDSFCNVPDNDPEKYQQHIRVESEGVPYRHYNLYYRIDHEIEPGKWPKTRTYLEHLFGDKLDVALDYLCLLYRNPTEKLPIICLVSAEKRTGKSTFLWWLRELFKENTTVIGNKEINDRFNDDYISKLVIGIDEAILEKRSVIEWIKSLVTSVKAKMDTKHVSRVEIDFIGKVVLTSNDEEGFVKIDDDENRFWVNRVAPFQGKPNPNLLAEMQPEIPMVLHYLKYEHKMKYKKEDRFWFNPSVYETDALRQVKAASRSYCHHTVTAYMQDQFIEKRGPVLALSSKELHDALIVYDGAYRNKVDKAYLERTLKKEMGITQVSGVRRISYKVAQSEEYQENEFTWTEEKKAPGRYFVFFIDQFLDEQTIIQLWDDAKADWTMGDFPDIKEKFKALCL